MSLHSTLISAGAAVAVCFAGSLACAAPAHADQNCFLGADWSGWRSPSPSVIYLRVNVNQIYELDLSAGSNQLQEPDMHLVSRMEGSDWVCSPLDLQLEVADDHGIFREPLIVKSITRLTPDQVKAIPARYRP